MCNDMWGSWRVLRGLGAVGRGKGGGGEDGRLDEGRLPGQGNSLTRLAHFPPNPPPDIVRLLVAPAFPPHRHPAFFLPLWRLPILHSH